MNYSEKLIYAYKKNFKPDMDNAYIKLKSRNDIAIWSNDPVYTINMIFGQVGGRQIDFPSNVERLKAKAKDFDLVAYETDPVNHRYTVCIPMNRILDVAMDVENKDNLTEDYISETAVIKYNEISYYTDTMNNEYLKNYFKHKEEE